MHKFVNDTKSVMRLAPKTEDLEYNENSKGIRKVESAIREYKASIYNMKQAAETAFDALQQVAKAFGTIANQCRSVCIADTSAYCSNSVKQINNDLTAFKVSLEGETVVHMTELMVLVDECNKLDTARTKVMHEYDTYRDSVTQKEAEYARRGKDLTVSKHYQGDVARRDELKKQYEDANASYKRKVNKVETEKLRVYENSMKTFSSSIAKFLGCLSKCMSEVSSRA